MTKARVPRIRYLLFTLKYGKPTENPRFGDNETLKRAITAEALRFFGEFGLSSVALKLLTFNPQTKIGMLRCSRDHIDEVRGFLALVSELDRIPARLIAIKTSGTIKSLAKG